MIPILFTEMKRGLAWMNGTASKGLFRKKVSTEDNYEILRIPQTGDIRFKSAMQGQNGFPTTPRRSPRKTGSELYPSLPEISFAVNGCSQKQARERAASFPITRSAVS